MDIKLLDMKSLLIIIIFALLAYLIYINYFENKTLESFKTRNSLSSYYQSDDDSDLTRDFKTNELRYTPNDIKYLPSNWNGSYTFKNSSNELCYITFLQINKDLLFIINKVNYVITGSNPDPYKIKDSNLKQCLPGTIIGKGELNQNESLFYLKHVYCSSNDDGTGNFQIFGIDLDESAINNFYGYIEDDGTIKLDQLDDTGASQGPALLEKDITYKFGPSAQYLLRTSYNIPVPNFKNSVRLIPDVCVNTEFSDYTKGELEKCYIPTGGLPTPDDEDDFTSGKEEYQFNAYGTGCAKRGTVTEKSYGDGDKYKVCPNDINKTCFIPIGSKNGQKLTSYSPFSECKTSYDMKIKNQSSLSYPYYLKDETTGNILDLCNYLEGFQSKKYNSAILMYVDNLSDVQTLNYDFFGIEKGQNSLTTKLDIMFPFMNNKILPEYRSDMSSEKSIRLTNCMENNMAIKNYQDILSQCEGKYSDTEEKYLKLKEHILKNTSKDQSEALKELYNVMENIDTSIDTKKANKLLQPTVWTLNFLENENSGSNEPSYTNDCSFILSTSKNYNKESKFEKYAEFDSFNNNTRLNLYKGGNKQKLVLENAHVINSLEEIMGSQSYNDDGANVDNNISNDFIMMSGNLRTYHPKKYLVPGQGSHFNPFGKEIYLQNTVSPSGKWIILGFNLSLNLDSGTSSNPYNSTLIKTLGKISRTIQESN